MAKTSRASFGKLLRAGRLRAGHSLRAAARFGCISPTFLSQVENGKAQPTKKLILNAAYFTKGVTRDELCAEARVLPPDIEITLVSNPQLWAKVRAFYTQQVPHPDTGGSEA